MSYKDIQPGKYKAHALGGVWTQVGKNATPCVSVNFEFESSPGVKEKIAHQMYLTQTVLKDGSTVMEKTMDTLIGTLGYNESKPLIQDSHGNPVFDYTFLADKEVEIVIELEPDQENPHKMYPRVRWVNEPNQSRFVGFPVEKVLGNINLKSAAAAARARMGTAQPAPQKPNQDDIPF